MSVEITRLDNGMRVVTDRMPTVESVTLGVWAGVGTRDERSDVNGVAHLLEHMAFKGTQRRRAEDIAIEIETVGGHLNAYTGREHTAYYAKILKQDVELAVDLIADILQHATFDRTSWNVSARSFCRRSARPTTRPTTSFSITFRKPPIRTRRSAGRSWARSR